MEARDRRVEESQRLKSGTKIIVAMSWTKRVAHSTDQPQCRKTFQSLLMRRIGVDSSEPAVKSCMGSFCIVWKFEKPPPGSFDDVWSDSDADGTEDKEIDERSRSDGWLPCFSIFIDDTHSSGFQLRTTGVLRAGEIRVDGTGSTGKGVRFGDNVETKSLLRYDRRSGHGASSSCGTCETPTHSFSLDSPPHCMMDVSP